MTDKISEAAFLAAIPTDVIHDAWDAHAEALGYDPAEAPPSPAFTAALNVFRRWAVQCARENGKTTTAPEFKPGDPAEPREAVGMFAQQVMSVATDPAGAWVPAWFHRRWDDIKPEYREYFRMVGAQLFGAGRKAGDEAAVLELQHQFNTWLAFAEQAERQEAARRDQKRWEQVAHQAGRASAFGAVAEEIRTRILELTGQQAPRLRFRDAVLRKLDAHGQPTGETLIMKPGDGPVTVKDIATGNLYYGIPGQWVLVTDEVEP